MFIRECQPSAAFGGARNTPERSAGIAPVEHEPWPACFIWLRGIASANATTQARGRYCLGMKSRIRVDQLLNIGAARFESNDYASASGDDRSHETVEVPNLRAKSGIC